MTALLALALCARASIQLSGGFAAGELDIDTVSVNGTAYHSVEIRGCSSLSQEALFTTGSAELPVRTVNVLLPPNSSVKEIVFLQQEWDTLPGIFRLPAERSDIHGENGGLQWSVDLSSVEEVFPKNPAELAGEGYCMGYSVATLELTPLRYMPGTGRLALLSSFRLQVEHAPDPVAASPPLRQTALSASIRERGIRAMVVNPEALAGYPVPAVQELGGRCDPLEISMAPSMAGDCVDLVIITSEELKDAFTRLAEHRARQGIITAVRTVEWIDQTYSGCDTPERIRNFLQDASEYWGTQSVLLGGDDHVVPVRQCNGWVYHGLPYPAYQMPSDDYYADLDGDWCNDGESWFITTSTAYLDMCVGRWPVDDGEDFDTMFEKLLLYEQPDSMDYARNMLMMAVNDACGYAADSMIEFGELMWASGSIPEYLDTPSELYYPHTLPQGDLCREAALEEMDRGYNLILHADHGEMHKLATAGRNTLGQFMWDSDFSTLGNEGRPSILWTLGCGPGHYDGAECYSEAGLTASSSSGLIAVISNARFGLFDQKVTYNAFFDALLNTGYCAEQHGIKPLAWPMCFLGEAQRISRNLDGLNFQMLHLLGSPMMHVWRGTPEGLTVQVQDGSLMEGVPSDISVNVTSGGEPLADAGVCLWSREGSYCVEMTDQEGNVLFSDVLVPDGGDEGDVWITALKRNDGLGSFSDASGACIPASVTLEVMPSKAPVLYLEQVQVDPRGDGAASPGEMVEIHITAGNSGGTEVNSAVASIEVSAGADYVAMIPDELVRFPHIPSDSSSAASSPLRILLKDDVPGGAAVELDVTFSCDGTEWKGSILLSILSQGYSITVMDPSIENSGEGHAEVLLQGMTLANCGLAEGDEVTIWATNFHPRAPVEMVPLNHPPVEPNSADLLEGQLRITITPDDPHSPWLMDRYPGCSFDIAVTSGDSVHYGGSVDASLLWQIQGTEVQPPFGLEVYETGQDFISLVWEHDDDTMDYYLYLDDGTGIRLVYPLPLPVRQATVHGLEPGRQYQLGVTAIDTLCRESARITISAGTGIPLVEGWPLHLQGSVSGGPLIADLDGDGLPEAAAASSFGLVYIFERQGVSRILYPPPDCDFDRFLGCAAGDIDGDGTVELAVTCQKYISQLDKERVGLILYRRNGDQWSAEEIGESRLNEQASSAAVAGTPVMFQADGQGSLELAFRTRGSSGGAPGLYVLQQNDRSRSWSLMQGFPHDLKGGSYGAPVAVDMDGDQCRELVLPVFGPAGTGTALRIADFDAAGAVSFCNLELSELDSPEIKARVFSTLAATVVDGDTYVAGVARSEGLNSDIKKVFVYTLSADPVEAQLVWATDWLDCPDLFGTLPGPSMGDVDGDAVPEVLYTLNTGPNLLEGVTMGWDLLTGSLDYVSDDVTCNPITADGGAHVRCQPVTGPGVAGETGSGVLSTYSTYLSAFAPVSGGQQPGFPAGSRDAAWSSPAVADMDQDGFPEILFIDYSGLASLYDWQAGGCFQEGWHMFQSNSLRNGVYVSGSDSVSMPLSLSGRNDAAESSSSAPAMFENSMLTVTVPSPTSRLSVCIDSPGSLKNPITVLVHSVDGRLVGSIGLIGLQPGYSRIHPVPEGLPPGVYSVTLLGLENGPVTGRTVVLADR